MTVRHPARSLWRHLRLGSMLALFAVLTTAGPAGGVQTHDEYTALESHAAAPVDNVTPDHGTAADHSDHGDVGHSVDGHGVHGGAPHLDGGALSIAWVIPFVGILLSIALFPLAAPRFWHHNYGLVSAFWAFCFLIPFALSYGLQLAIYEVMHVAFLEYIPFIILIGSLFVIAGGVRLTGTLVGTPSVNCAILGLGTVLASLMGTTGAAMLLIRPLLRANEHRASRVHIVVFFIFLVANIGGSLTPLGDPPLFLGFLQGVNFFWVTQFMFLPMLLVSVAVLVIFYFFDSFMYKRDLAHYGAAGDATAEAPPSPADARPTDAAASEALALHGKINLVLIFGVAASVLLQGVWHSGIVFEFYHVPVKLEALVSQGLMLFLAFLSLQLTDWNSRVANGFTWFPIEEVGRLFAGIFITMIPAISMLRAGLDGPLSIVIAAVSDNGEPINAMYFWATGVLSSFLDNAPTYLVFFNTAGGDAQHLMADIPTTLLAISAGAVFMGANTYIGNAPNFMVKAIAEEQGINMPSFFGYMAWSVSILGPLFVLTTLVFFL